MAEEVVWGPVQWVDRFGTKVLRQSMKIAGFTEAWIDVPTVPPEPELESEAYFDNAEKLAKYIADKIFKAGDINGFVADRMAFKAISPSGEIDLGGLCKSAMVNVIIDALLEQKDVK